MAELRQWPDLACAQCYGWRQGIGGLLAAHFPFGQRIQRAPDALRRAFLKQYITLAVANNMHAGAFYRQRLARFLARDLCRQLLLLRLAILRQRALLAKGLAAQADRGAEVHHGLGVVGHAPGGSEVIGNLPELVFNSRLFRPASNGEIAGQHSFYIAVQYWRLNTHGKCSDGAGSRAANTGQSLKCIHRVRELPLIVPGDDLCGLVQIAGAGIVAEAGPQMQDPVSVGRRQVCDPGEAIHESLEIGDNRADLGLLQHDFRHPDSVGAGIILPGQVVAAMLVKPVQYLANEGGGFDL